MKDVWSVYGFVNTESYEIFYIGMTSQPIAVRFHEHVQCCQAGTTAKDIEMRSLQSQGVEIVPVRLDSASTEATARTKEKEWIYRGINLGWRLMNEEALKFYERSTSSLYRGHSPRRHDPYLSHSQMRIIAHSTWPFWRRWLWSLWSLRLRLWGTSVTVVYEPDSIDLSAIWADFGDSPMFPNAGYVDVLYDVGNEPIEDDTNA